MGTGSLQKIEILNDHTKRVNLTLDYGFFSGFSENCFWEGRWEMYSVCQLPAATILYLAQKISATRRAETRDLGQTAGRGSLSLDEEH